MVLDKFNIDNLELAKGSLARDVAEVIQQDPKLSDSVLQTHALTIAYSKGLVKPNQNSALMALQLQLANSAGLGGLVGQAGLGGGLQAQALGVNPLSAALGANPLTAGMASTNSLAAAAALGPNPLVAAGLGLGSVLGNQLAATQLLQAPLVNPGILPGQLGMQQVGLPLVVPGMAASYGGGGRQKKNVQCYNCKQWGHYANHCDFKKPASGA